MFFDEPVDIARYDQVKYPQLDKLTDRMLSVFWRPEEVDLSKDKIDFQNLNEHEQHIFTSNLKRQILLDSVQGRAPVLAFLPIASLPELEPVLTWWSAFETLHSRSYSHIIRNIYANPSKVFDTILDIPQIMDCGINVTYYYDNLMSEIAKYEKATHHKTKHKEALYLALLSVNALEGIRFYVSFACAFAFAENKKMEGNAKIIRLIMRDEAIHLAITTQILKLLLEDDPDFKKVKLECAPEAINIFTNAVEDEKTWAKYLCKDGSMIGLNEKLLADYAEWIGHKRMKALDIESPYSPGRTNPLPWMDHWTESKGVQVAPQETEISSYLIGGIKQDKDVLQKKFKKFEL